MDKILDDVIAELAARGIQLPQGTVRIGGFGDSEALSESLIGLILAGSKRATCSLLWSYEFNGDAVPEGGDIEVVLDWQGRPRLVRQVTTVEVVPFDRVTADFAASEGEGDCSLRHWQTEHWRYFTDECRRIGRPLQKSMPLVCERFEVLHALR
jgi:uncharacterized protein YhfF